MFCNEWVREMMEGMEQNRSSAYLDIKNLPSPAKPELKNKLRDLVDNYIDSATSAQEMRASNHRWSLGLAQQEAKIAEQMKLLNEEAAECHLKEAALQEREAALLNREKELEVKEAKLNETGKDGK